MGRTVNLRFRMYEHSSRYKYQYGENALSKWNLVILKIIKHKNRDRLDALAKKYETKFIQEELMRVGFKKLLNKMIPGHCVNHYVNERFS